MLGGFSVLFEAPLEKVKIVTDDSGGLRLRPQENEETKQIVIIKKNGKVRVKRYSYRLEFNGDRKFFDRTFKFDEEITQKILASIRDCFNNREGNIIGLDARPWTLDVTDENGRKNQLVGIVNGDESVSKISSYIRETLDLDYLWLFDGKDTKDEIKKVILETRHNLNNTIKIEKLIITGIHFLVWIEIPCQIFLYKKEDICCPLVIQSIHHKNHERRLNKCPIMILS